MKACVEDRDRENLYQHVTLVGACSNTFFTNMPTNLWVCTVSILYLDPDYMRTCMFVKLNYTDENKFPNACFHHLKPELYVIVHVLMCLDA